MDISKFFSKVFLWMSIGLAITFLTGQIIANNPSMTKEVFSSWYFLIVIVELVTVIVLSARINKMSPTVARIAFIFYSFLSGLTFASVFIVYELTSIMYVFLATSLIMLVFGILGYFIKLDLTKLGNILIVTLILTIIMSLINIIFMKNAGINLGLSVLIIIIFIGFIVFDMQKIKRIFISNPNNQNLPILGALELYLDFINIFIRLLSIFGKEK